MELNWLKATEPLWGDGSLFATKLHILFTAKIVWRMMKEVIWKFLVLCGQKYFWSIKLEFLNQLYHKDELINQGDFWHVDQDSRNVEGGL